MRRSNSAFVYQVSSPESERKQEPPESTETETSSLPPQIGPRSQPPQTDPPSLPEMDFFHSDPFTDRESQETSEDLSKFLKKKYAEVSQSGKKMTYSSTLFVWF